MIKRKYVGVPTQEEITQQYMEMVNKTKDINKLDDILEFKKSNPSIDIEINGDSLTSYNNEEIEYIRFEYKNILFYINVENGEYIQSTCITLYDDEGEQFADEIYNNYSEEIERVAKMGILKLTE